MVLTVYKLDFSPPVRAVLMTIDALKLTDVKFVDVNLFTREHLSEEYAKINPQQTVPTLKDDDFVIWDSHAIAAYLVGKYGKDDSLYPKDLKKRAIVDQRLHFDSGMLFPPARQTSGLILFGNEKTVRPDIIEKFEAAYALADKFLSSSTWLAGDQLTIADICCVATISSINGLLKIDEKKYPNLAAWLQRCSNLDFYQKCNLPGLTMLLNKIQTKLAEI